MGNEYNLVLESMFTLYKDAHLPNSHFSFLCSHGDFIEEYTDLFKKLSKFETWESVFMNRTFDEIMEKVSEY